MKPFDSKGEYTPDEVKAALAGVDGTRPLSFRYERLDSNDKFIENIDYVQSCSIENNSLADIKRTAKFDILDTGRMNYLQDRIKPYARLQMPTDVGYSEYVKSIDPLMWLKMDDRNSKFPGTIGYATINNDMTCSTRSTAYGVSESNRSKVTASMQLGSSTLRPEFWASYAIADNSAMQITVSNNNPTVPLSMEIYRSATSTSDLEALSTYTLLPNGGSWVERTPFPRTGYYYVRVLSTSSSVSASATIDMYHTSRIDDSSGNRMAMVADAGVHMEVPGLLNNSGTSISVSPTVSGRFGADHVDYLNLRSSGPYSLTFWDKNSDKKGSESYFEFGFGLGYITIEKYTKIDGTGSVYISINPYNSDTPTYTGSITVPVGVYTHGNPHMTTVILDPTGSFGLYVDAVKVGTFPVTSTGFQIYTPILQSVVSYGFWYGYSDATLTTDEVTLYRKALTQAEVSNLYTKALNQRASRSGYVEWPQGVFVLSSPKRTMVDGNYVHRDVEGYDKLVTLKEDSFDYRYSVPAGMKYVDGVNRVLQSSNMPKRYLFSDPIWSGNTGSNKAVITSDTSATLTTVDANAVMLRTTDKSLTISGLYVAAKVSVPATGRKNTNINVTVTINDVVKDYYFIIDATSVKAQSPTGTIITVPYDPVAHAYLRMVEKDSVIYWDNSSDGVTWQTMISETITAETSSPVTITFYADHDAALVGSAMSNVVINASAYVPRKVTTSTSTLPTTLEWENGTSKLQIINDLLGAINYESAFYDEDGIFVARPYITPDKRTSQFTYATDQYSVLHGDVDQTVDLFKIPNKFICVVSDPDRPALVGVYTNNNPMSPTSTVSRGRTIVDYRSEQAAPDQTTLDALAARLAFEASQVYEVIEFETGVMPIHQNADVFTVDIDGMVINDKYSEHKWSMDLEVGGSMKHTVRRVVSL